MKSKDKNIPMPSSKKKPNHQRLCHENHSEAEPEKAEEHQLSGAR